MTSSTSLPLCELARLDDPAFYARDPQAVFARLRRESPVYWHDEARFWALSRYQEVRHVFRHPALFSSQTGVFITDRKFARMNPFEFGGEGPILPADGANILETDPPWHTEYRKAVVRTQTFSRGWAEALLGPLREIVAGVFDRVPENATINFDDISLEIATRVAVEFLGLPREDLDRFMHWTTTFINATDSSQPEDLQRGADVTGAMWNYMSEALASPTENGSGAFNALAEASRRAAAIDRHSLLKFALDLMIAGTVNNRSSMSGGVIALSEWPEQRELLLQKPELMPNAVEEIIRWVTPAPHICRTAVRTVDLQGTTIREGDYVVLLLASANRDETVWADPDRFNVGRPTRPPHMSFGHGIHACLGAPLARAEIHVFLKELLRRFPRFEMTGPIVKRPSTMVNSFAEVPVRLAA
jgi:cytochrome P450